MKKLIAFVAACLLLIAATPDKKTTIFVIGDSTAANKDLSKGKLERGWAMMLQQYFDTTYIRVDNHAVNGRSSKSFIDEGRWDKVLSLIRPGDYVIIQFGHNDEKPKADRHTDPGSTFDYNLAKFVRETREKGGIPVLMNCVVRRNFFVKAPENDDDEKLRTSTFKDGAKMVEGDSLIDTHGLYRVAPRDVALRMNCHFVDANKIPMTWSRAWAQKVQRNCICGIVLAKNQQSPRANKTIPTTTFMVPQSWLVFWPMPSVRRFLCSRNIASIEISQILCR